MNDWHDNRMQQEKALSERIKQWAPLAFVIILALSLASSILAWGEIYAWGLLGGAVLLTGSFAKPEVPLIIVTILAPLELWTEQYLPTLLPGSGITPLNALVLLLIAGAWAQRYSTTKPAAEATSIDKPLLLVVLIGAIAVITGTIMWHFESADVGQYLEFSTAFLMYWVARRRFRSHKAAAFLVFTVVAMVLFESLLVIKQLSGTSHDVFAWKLKFTVTGTIVNGNSNDTGAYLSEYGMIAFGMFLGLRKSIWRWASLGVFALSVIATFDTYSRAAYIALGVAALAMLLYKQRRWLFPALAVCVLLFPLLPSSVSERAGTSGDTSAENRKEFWKEGIKMAFMHPITGVGWRGYFKSEHHDPHNMYVLVAAEQGLVGITVFIMLLAATGKELLKANKNARTPLTQALALGMFGAYVSMLVNNMFGSRLVWFYAGEHFWLLMGVLVVLTQQPPDEPDIEIHDPDDDDKKVKAISPWRYKSYV